eukprot:5778839-Pyramimonas_sp.AAC.1
MPFYKWSTSPSVLATYRSVTFQWGGAHPLVRDAPTNVPKASARETRSLIPKNLNDPESS